MKIRGRGLVVAGAASAAGGVLLLHLFCATLLPPSPFSLFPGRQWTPWNAVMEEKQVMEYLSGLVERLPCLCIVVCILLLTDKKPYEKYTMTGEDQARLSSTRFSCQKDVHAHVCLSGSQVRIEASENQEVMVYQPYANSSSTAVSIKPYARQEDETAMERVNPVHIFYGIVYDVPGCDFTHNVPAMVFSSRGFSGNSFHEFSEIIIPLFLTCHHFSRQVQFVITDLRPSLVEKYRSVLIHLSGYDPVTLLDGKVHCFPGAVVGLKFHSNLGVNSSQIPKGHDMSQFREFLREAYSLEVAKVGQVLAAREKPVLLLVSRRTSRVFLNEEEMVGMMTQLGYDVIVADPNMTENVDQFAQVVSQCSVMVGAHGAGLTNVVFLPAGAVVVQVVPLGLDWAANAYFGEPASDMDLKYLPYKIEADESSLAEEYGRNHSVVTDPMTVFIKGYKAARAVYIDGQNLKINVPRFKDTLIQALRVLHNSTSTD